MEGEDNNLKGFTTKRRKGYVSSIRFGGARLRNLLKGVEIVCKEESKLKRCFEWKENVRSYRLENRENKAGCFLLYSVTNGDGKRHRLFFTKGKGFIKG